MRHRFSVSGVCLYGLIARFLPSCRGTGGAGGAKALVGFGVVARVLAAAAAVGMVRS